MSNIVITGGAGFIGSNLTRHHLRLGDRVTVIDNMATSVTIDDIEHECDFIELDLTTHKPSMYHADLWSKWEHVNDSLHQSDIVYHLASSVGVKYVDKNPKTSLRNSFDINNNMFQAFEKHNCRVIFASTSEVYGDTNNAREIDTLKIGSPDTLRWGYACGKLMSEFLLRTYNFPSTTLRFFNVTGRGQISTHGMVLPTFIEKALRDEDIVIYGNGNQTRTFCDIRDAIGMITAVTDLSHQDQIYNVGNPRNVMSIHELANMVIQVTNSNSIIKFVDYQAAFTKEFGEIYERKPNIDKISKYYKPVHDVESIITNML